MQFALAPFASLIAGAFAAYVVPPTPWHGALKEVVHDEFPKEVKSMISDPAALPDIQFTVGKSKVSLTGGKATGLNKAVRPRGHCVVDSHEVKCYLAFDGLHVSYDAVSTKPEKEFPVKVYTQSSVVEVVLENKAPKYELKDARLLNLFLYVQKADFSDEPEKTVVFNNELKLRLHSLFVEAVKNKDLVKEAFAKAVSDVKFPEA